MIYKKPSYIFFHLNLLFSSLKKSDYKEVIKRCYWGIKYLIDRNIQISIEANGKSLEIINNLDPSFIVYLRNEIDRGNIEFVGSGYVQMISPLAPFDINKTNIDIGLRVYKKLLNSDPKFFLINEMAFSSSILDLIERYDFEGIIMDIDNMALATNISKKTLYSKKFIKNKNTKSIKILWSDSRLFQSFQRYIHGDIDLKNYVERLSQHRDINKSFIPLYTNDLEVFNYRPGRFNEEESVKENEWEKIVNLFELLHQEGYRYYKLSSLPRYNLNNQNQRNTLTYNSEINHAVCVKKQPKYNLSRWAVTGRMDQSLNTFCYFINDQINIKKLSIDNLKTVLFFWSSDLRTHLSSPRYKELQIEMKKFTKDMNLDYQKVRQFDHNLYGAKIKKSDINNFQEIKFDGDLLKFKRPGIEVEFYTHKGLAINKLCFDNSRSIISSFNNNYFDSITHGVDFFSGTSLFEIPSTKKRYTDLSRITNLTFYKSKNSFSISGAIDLGITSLKKVITIGNKNDLHFEYFFSKYIKIDGVIRLGNLIFNRDFAEDIIATSNIGGDTPESFVLNNYADHSKRVSMIVSSAGGFPCTNGKISLKSGSKNFRILLDNSQSFCLPMFVNEKVQGKWFTRLIFSLSEVDDNSMSKKIPSYFSFKIQKN